MFTAAILRGSLPAAALACAAICLFVSAIGFRRTVYFVSIGYGYSVAAMSIACMLIAGRGAGLATWIAAAVLAAYGLRLGTFLAIRESKPGYRASQAPEAKSRGPGALAVKLVIWISVCVLYVAMFLPTLSRFASEASGRDDPLPLLSLAGAVVMAAGALIEALSDFQKARAKSSAPDRFCDSGLFRLSRCPSYFGEILVWTGNVLAGASLLGGAVAWIVALVGYACIALIMLGSARSLELKQEKRYGNDPEFRRYSSSVPVLLPFVPIYSLKDIKVYLGRW